MRLPRLLDLRRANSRSLWALALVFTLLNAAKPLVIDDAAYYYFARQITRDPLRPYAFSMMWYQWPHPANEVLAPPVLPYWWAIALALFGENAFLWKLWLFPFSLLFVGGLDGLLRRFAHGVVTPVLWMTVLSPTFLPSLNLMLDVPALGLSLTALAIFFRAFNRGSMAGGAVAGLLAGLAMETKYTAFLAPVVMLLYASLFWGRPFKVNFRRRMLVAFLAVLVAAGMFVFWEAMIASFHGESHFLCNLRQNDSTFRDKVNLALPLFLILGSVSAPVILLSLTALGSPRTVVIGMGVALAGGYGLIAMACPSPVETARFEDILFGAYSLFTLGTAAAILARPLVCHLTEMDPKESDVFLLIPPTGPETRFTMTDGFLVLWLGIELLGCFAITPFPAVRRVMGIVIVGTLLAARLASRTCQVPRRQGLLRGVAAAGIAWGFSYYGLDLMGAFAEKKAVERSAEIVRQAEPTGRIWYVGHWGFQHYAERAGMKPVIPEQSYLSSGDWLVVPDGDVNFQVILVDSNCTEPAAVFDVDDALPLRTLPNFYGGSRPLKYDSGPHLTVRIYRVIRGFVPASDRDKM